MEVKGEKLLELSTGVHRYSQREKEAKRERNGLLLLSMYQGTTTATATTLNQVHGGPNNREHLRLRPSPLPPTAWKTLRVSHIPTRKLLIDWGGGKKITYQRLSVATLRYWRGLVRDNGGSWSETLAGYRPERVSVMAGIRRRRGTPRGRIYEVFSGAGKNCGKICELKAYLLPSDLAFVP
jgi:hypothetical protein